MNKTRHRKFPATGGVLALALALGAGCRTSAPAPDGGPSAANECATVMRAARFTPLRGEIVRADLELGYVLVDCGAPATEGAIGEVRRGQETVGRVRAAAQRRGRIVAADILDGQPRAGDGVRPAR